MLMVYNRKLNRWILIRTYEQTVIESVKLRGDE